MQSLLSIITSFDTWLKAFILIVPTLYLPGIKQESLQLMLFHYGTLILFSIGILKDSQRKFSNPSLLLLISVSILLALTRSGRGFSLTFINIVFGSLLYYTIITSAKDAKSYVKYFLVLAWINIAFFILQVFGLNLIYSEPISCGAMAKEKYLAIFLSFIAPMSTTIPGLFALLIGGILLLIKSYTALLAFFASLAMLCWLKRKTDKTMSTLGILIVIAIFAAFLVPMLFSNFFYKISTRQDAWIFTLKESFQNILLGRGLDSFDNYIATTNVSATLIASTYSEYLRMMYEFGVIPFLIIIVSAIFYFKQLWIKGREYFTPKIYLASIIAILISMAFQDTMHVTRLGVLAVVILALFEVSLIDTQEKGVAQ